MKKIMLSNYSMFFAVLLSISSLTTLTNDVEIRLSDIELQQIFQNKDKSYVCLHPQISPIQNILNATIEIEMETIGEAEVNTPVRSLKEHIDLGYSIAEQDAVLHVLDYAKQIIEHNLPKLENPDDALANVNAVIDQVSQGLLSLNAEKLAFLQDADKPSEDLTLEETLDNEDAQLNEDVQLEEASNDEGAEQE